MNINELKINESTQLTNIANINTQAFDKIIEHIKNAFKIIRINPDEMQIYYQRNIDATSIIAIQLEKVNKKNNQKIGETYEGYIFRF